MKYGVLVILMLCLPWKASAQIIELEPSHVEVLNDPEGRGAGLLSFELCQPLINGVVMNATLVWEPEDIDVTEHSEYWTKLVEPESPVESAVEAWDRLRDTPDAMWDIQPTDPKRDISKVVRLVLPEIGSIHQEGRCNVAVIIGSSFVEIEDLALDTVKLRLHVTPSARRTSQ